MTKTEKSILLCCSIKREKRKRLLWMHNSFVGVRMEKRIFHMLFPDLLKYESECFDCFRTLTKSFFESHSSIKHDGIQFQ